jgi:hypothetical protein
MKAFSQVLVRKLSSFGGPIRRALTRSRGGRVSKNNPPAPSTRTPMEGLDSESGAPQMFRRTLLPIPFAAALFVLSACGSNSTSSPAASAPAASAPVASVSAQDALTTATPIKHLVVLFVVVVVRLAIRVGLAAVEAERVDAAACEKRVVRRVQEVRIARQQ